eukprot:3286023-Prymnesium_polylepis.1
MSFCRLLAVLLLVQDATARVTMRISLLGPNSAPYGLRELRLDIVITHQGNADIENAQLWYAGSGFDTEHYTSVPTIKPGRTKTVRMVLKSRWHMEINRIPDHVEFVMKTPDGTVVSRVEGAVDLSWFVGALGPPVFNPADFDLTTFNILIFGPKGSGKSAFINSVHALTQSSTDGEAMRAFVPVHGGADHCTVRYHKIEGMNTLPLSFWDTW